jgi:hypothetical protein
MNQIELTNVEIRDYKDACHRDDLVARSPSPWVSRDAYYACHEFLRSRGIMGDPNKVTVTFRGGDIPHLYELHYTVTL